MRKAWLILVVACMLFGSFPLLLHGEEMLRFEGDSKEWIVGGKTARGEATFVPLGQTGQNSTKASILNQIPAEGFSLESHYKFIKQNPTEEKNHESTSEIRA